MGAETSQTPSTHEEAWNAALSYLSYRARSRHELERQLRRRGYDTSVVSRVLARCERLDLLDDLSFATTFARDRIRLRPRGVARLESELIRKGVSRENAREGIRAALAEEEVTEHDLLEAAASKRWARLANTPADTARQRLYRHLVRAGFPRQEVRRIVARLVDERQRGEANRKEAGRPHRLGSEPQATE